MGPIGLQIKKTLLMFGVFFCIFWDDSEKSLGYFYGHVGIFITNVTGFFCHNYFNESLIQLPSINSARKLTSAETHVL